MIKSLILSVFLLPAVLFAQVNITGKIISQADTKPVANANVFLSNATIGAHTADDGTFTLSNVKPGKYELVVSIVGFDTYNQSINVENNNINLPPITIFPKSIALSQVTIKAERNDFDAKRNFDWFKEEFLGNSAAARDCKIINPEMVDLNWDEHTGALTGTSADFLIIDNAALGYRIKYLLKGFTLVNPGQSDRALSYSGFVVFEKMQGPPRDEEEWQRQRQQAYEGSITHFLKAAIADRITQENFRVLWLPGNTDRPADTLINRKVALFQHLSKRIGYRDSLAWWVKKSKLPRLSNKAQSVLLTRKDIIPGPDKAGLYTLKFGSGALYVTYNRYHQFNRFAMSKLFDAENTDNTIVYADDDAMFDRNGKIVNPQALSFNGVWSRSRVANLLPLDYEPQQDNFEVDSLLEKKLDAKLNSYTGGHSEKAYLQFDKPYYATGDTIYFKAYVTEDEKHTLTQQSSILYADLVNGDNKIIKTLKLQLTGGFAWGDFALADTLKNGSYHVRAYTNWMRNAGESSFFDREIPVAGIPGAKRIPESGQASGTVQPSIRAAGRPDLQFFTEGGNLLTGVKSKIAFKAVAPGGMGILVKGLVTDDKGKQVGEFASNAMGMGAVELMPDANKTYKANVIYADGSTGLVTLPPVSVTGYELAIDNTSDEHSVKVTVWGTKQNARDKISIVAQAGNNIYYSAKCAVPTKGFTTFIFKSELPTGVVRITLFNQSGEPLNERLVFVNNNDLLNLDVTSEKKTYQSREKVKINLNANSKDGQPVNGSFSAAVIDETKVTVDEANENNILTSLLLTSELKGNIEKPNYYFTNVNTQTNADLDLLMLTQGYRQFEWKKVLSDTIRAFAYQPEKDIKISGRVKKGGKPFAGAKVTLFTTTGGTLLIDTLTNAEGNFTFKNLVFADSTKFVVQAKVAKGQDAVTLDIDTLRPPKAVMISKKATIARLNNRSQEIDMSAYIQNQKQFYIEQQKYGINKHPLMLKEVRVMDKKSPKELENSQNLNGKGNADQLITAKDLETLACGRLFDCLQARLTGVFFLRIGPANYHMYVRRLTGMNPQKNSILPDEMQYMVDGMFVDSDIFFDTSPGDIDAIEVLMGAHYGAIYGSRGASGIVSLTTKHAHKVINYYRYAPGVITYMPKGYYKAREFYSPQYDSPKTNQKMADLRSTIFWKPDITTDKDGNASFSFFNADGKGTYRVVIEGIDADGNLGRQVYRYKVE